MLAGLMARPLFKGRDQVVLETTRFGQCRLVKSGTNVVLQPFQGNLITIAGAAVKIPAGGVSLPPTGLAPFSLQYLYACMGGGGIALEPSTVGHTTDPTTGVEVKIGDPTRTLVGMARPIAGPAFADSLTQRFVISYFNRQPLVLSASIGASVGSFSTGAYTILSNALLLEFLTWAGGVSSRFQGRVQNNVADSVSSTATFLDASNTPSYTAVQAYKAGALMPVACCLDAVTTEGYHTFNVYAQQDVVSTASYTGGITGLACVHSGVIQG